MVVLRFKDYSTLFLLIVGLVELFTFLWKTYSVENVFKINFTKRSAILKKFIYDIQQVPNLWGQNTKWVLFWEVLFCKGEILILWVFWYEGVVDIPILKQTLDRVIQWTEIKYIKNKFLCQRKQSEALKLKKKYKLFRV